MRGARRSDQPEVRGRHLHASAVLAILAAAVLLVVSVAAAAQAQAVAPSLVLEQSHDGAVTCVSPEAACRVVDLYGQDGNTDALSAGHGPFHSPSEVRPCPVSSTGGLLSCSETPWPAARSLGYDGARDDDRGGARTGVDVAAVVRGRGAGSSEVPGGEHRLRGLQR